MESMKITAGMGEITSYETLVTAGAGEVFCGFVPYFWKEKYGNVLPLNRREVLFYHVQIGTYEDMRILKKMMDTYQVPVSITFNSLYYIPEQLPVIADMITSLTAIGFKEYIIADIKLIRYLSCHHIPCHIHVSGEIGEWSRYTIKLLLENFSNDTTKITRLIFHRKMNLEDMKACIDTAKHLDPSLEFEAFCMNEKCHYTGGYCNSLHCDEMIHLCNLEYHLGPMMQSQEDTLVEFHTSLGEEGLPNTSTNPDPEDTYIPGESGCGLCTLASLKAIGITHLKVVGRGSSADCIAQDIKAVKEVLQTGDITPYKMHCNHNCYYQ